MSESPQSIPKRIIICCDGTWQSAVSGVKGSPSNITRLARSLERVAVDKDGKTWQQIVWYDSGVGTTSSKVGRIIEGAVGGGLEGNVIEAYNFVVLNWCPGDQIFCFGFSRGAYTARTIAGLISDIGICEPRLLNDFPDLWAQYTKMDGQRFYGSDEYFEWMDGIPAEKQPEDLGYKNRNFIWVKHPRGEWATSPESREIELVGVYDTVGAIGVPSVRGFEAKLPWSKDDPKFHNVRLNRNIKRAFHALALDEHREAFAPTMYHLPEGPVATEADIAKQEEEVSRQRAEFYKVQGVNSVPKPTKEEVTKRYHEASRSLIRMKESQKKQSELLQVWFPGVHINIGGGSSDTLVNEGDMEEMANITFAWMLHQVAPYLAINETVINQEYRARQNHIDELNDNIRKYEEKLAQEKAEHAKESWIAFAKRSVNVAADYVAHPFSHKGPDLRRRDYGWGTGTIIDSYTTMYVPNGSQPRTPGAYAQDKKHAAPGQTNEMIHPTVGYRMAITQDEKDKDLQYKPIGLEKKDFFRRKNEAGQWEYSIKGVVLPEYIMARSGTEGVESRFEALAIEGEKAQQWISETFEVPMYGY